MQHFWPVGVQTEPAAGYADVSVQRHFNSRAVRSGGSQGVAFFPVAIPEANAKRRIAPFGVVSLDPL